MGLEACLGEGLPGKLGDRVGSGTIKRKQVGGFREPLKLRGGTSGEGVSGGGTSK